MAQHWIATRPGDLDVFVFEEHEVRPPQQGEVTSAVRARKEAEAARRTAEESVARLKAATDD